MAIGAKPDDPAALRLARRLRAQGAADAVVLRPWPWMEVAKGGKGMSQIGWEALARVPDVRQRLQSIVIRSTTCEGLTSLTVPVPNCVAGDFDALAAALGPQVRPLGDVWLGRAAQGAVMRGAAGAAATDDKGRIVTVLVDGVTVYKGLPTKRRPDVHKATVPPGAHTAAALVGGRVWASQTVQLDAGDRHVLVLDLETRSPKGEAQVAGGPSAPPRRACSPDELIRLRAALLPPGAIEINLGAGGPGPRPDVACTLVVSVGADGAVTALPALGQPARPDAATCTRIAREAETRRAPAGLRCGGTLRVTWQLPGQRKGDDGAGRSDTP